MPRIYCKRREQGVDEDEPLMDYKLIWIKSMATYPASQGVQCDIEFCEDSDLRGNTKVSRAMSETETEAVQSALGNACHLFSVTSVLVWNWPEWQIKWEMGQVWKGGRTEAGFDQWTQDKLLLDKM